MTSEQIPPDLERYRAEDERQYPQKQVMAEVVHAGDTSGAGVSPSWGNAAFRSYLRRRGDAAESRKSRNSEAASMASPRHCDPPSVLALLLSGGLLAMAETAAAQTSPTLSGAWQLSCTGGNGKVRQVKLQIEQNGSTLSGSFSGPRRTGKLSGTVQGGRVSLQIGTEERSITLTGSTDGRSMTVHGPNGGKCTASHQ